ncbi:DUF1911 domain-containing protein [Janthinobacterium rivuli]|uniref:DUF1911 domain-containing protein n=1 Tax=Janthinobacterium rivuli TaxID=2751478 RepID=A0ABY8IB92_9BURK|nr:MULTISPECIES: PoNe immunity protein domain-containing protein [Janthinobacterium]PHV32465.1 hypothetical protein CSQ94_13820 [Janthinobacterium sp. BJB312]WFR82225.1 DUF1911 domain-containing protein [Janthinobacterium rivuli]
MQFHEKRRQQFLNDRYYELEIQYSIDESFPRFLRALHASDSNAEDRSRISEAIADQLFKIFLLNYTAGESLDILRNDLPKVVGAYEQHAKYIQEYANDPIFPPFRFAEVDNYERAMQLISLCYLLHRRDLLPRLAAMLDGAFAGKDTLYEDLFSYELKDRFEVDEWYHDKPYRDIINSFYRDTPEESISDVQKYLKAWYTSMKKAFWHDSHLNMREDGGAYFGYWAIEAAAAVYLLELDDRSFRDHIVYPKDLLDYARKLDKQAPPTPLAPRQLRVEGGNPCPQAGYWFTPAIADSLRHFEQGEIMPVSMDWQYGATIWQWSKEQLPPLKPTVK